MNSMVSLPILAAVPVATPSIAANDPQAMLGRLEHAIELLRTRYIRDDWKIDEIGAERALRYFRAGCPDDDDEWGATIMFMSSHGLSFDWICGGEVGSMICMLASYSRQAKRAPDPILAAVDAHARAYEAFSACVVQQDNLEDQLPKDRRRSSFDPCGDLEIAETGDPKWIAFQQAYDQLSNAETDAAIELINVKPTTVEGAVELLRYVVMRAERGDEWPTGLVDDDVEENASIRRGRPWTYFLHRNMVELLSQIAAPSVHGA